MLFNVNSLNNYCTFTIILELCLFLQFYEIEIDYVSKKLYRLNLQMKVFFSMFLIIHIYNDNKIVSAIIVTETLTHKKKFIKFFRKSSTEIKAEIL